ncbi:MAG: ATP-binding cassette domain-containing protein [Bacteroidota bacterium]
MMILSSGLKFAYTERQRFQFPDITASVGDPLLILGNSGKGKTTFLHLLGGLLQAHEGEIIINETDITRLSIQDLDRFRGRNIGIIFQQSHFVAALTVRENLQLAQKLSGNPVDHDQIMDMLARLGIAAKSEQSTYRLSIGEQQRVAIARALINRPKLLLADEPTSSLDDYHTQEVINLLEEQAHAAGSALIIVTHDNRLKEHFSHSVELD